MIKIIYQRLLQAVIVAWSVGTLTFILMRLLPGDVAYRIAAGRYGYDYVNTDIAVAIHQELGLDRPVFELYFHWLWDLLHFNLGNSLISGQPVLNAISHQLGHSVLLSAAAIIISLLIAIPVGIYCGRHSDGFSDHVALFVSILVRAQPVFLVGLIMIIIFSLQFNLLPVAGFGELKFLILPALALALSMAAMTNRMVRNATQKVIHAPYFEFARLKGLSFDEAFQQHGRLNISLPIIAFVGIQAITLIEGIVMIESLFSWPGIGHALSHAIFQRDIPTIQGAAILMGLIFVAINTLVDVLQYYLDPRQRYARHNKPQSKNKQNDISSL